MGDVTEGGDTCSHVCDSTSLGIHGDDLSLRSSGLHQVHLDRVAAEVKASVAVWLDGAQTAD